MIIEFVGIPGSGKTTLSHKLRQELALIRPIVQTHEVRHKYIQQGKFGPITKLNANLNTVLSHRLFLKRCLWRVLWAPRRFSDKIAAIKLIMVTLDNYAYLKRKQCRKEIVIFDEGIAQRAFTIMIERNSILLQKAILDYVYSMPKPDVLIFLKIDSATAVKRIRNRTQGITPRLQSLSDKELTQVLDDAQEMFITMVDELEKSHFNAVRIMRLQTEDVEAECRLVFWLNSVLDTIQEA